MMYCSPKLLRVYAALCVFFCSCVLTECSQNETVLDDSETVCRNSSFFYSCNLTTPSTYILWRNEVLGSLLIRSDGDVGDVVSSSPTFNYGAVLTANIESKDTELNLLASTLFIEPPLDELNVNGTYLNGTIITCEQSQFIELSFTITIAGIPSPPRNLRHYNPDDATSIFLKWDAPEFTGGNEIFTHRYTISIPNINYYTDKTCTEVECIHIIRADGGDVMFNTPYTVEVVAVNTCGDESSPQTIAVSFGAKPSQASLSAQFRCSDPRDVNVVLKWEDNSPSSMQFTPIVDALSVEVDAPGLLSSNECSHLTPNATNCSYTTTVYACHTVTLTSSNLIGTTTSRAFFEFHPLTVDYSHLSSTSSPAVNVTLSSLCIETPSEMFVGVLFGKRVTNDNGNDCEFSQRKTEYFDSSSLYILVDTNAVPLPSGSEESYEYCAKVELNSVPSLNCSGSTDDDGLTMEVILVISVVGTLLLSLPMGVLVGCCGALCVRKCSCRQPRKKKFTEDSMYDSADTMKSGIATNRRGAYGYVQQITSQPRKMKCKGEYRYDSADMNSGITMNGNGAYDYAQQTEATTTM